MRFLFIIFFFMLLFSFVARGASYQWGEFNGWEVGVNEETNFGCYVMSPNYVDGSILKVGYINIKKTDTYFYLYLGNLNWTSLRDGNLYPMEINFFPHKSAYNGDARVVNVEGYNFLQFNIDDPDFLADFAKKDAIDFLYNGKSIAYLRLEGSYIAMQEFVACQIAVAESGVANVALERKLQKKNSRDPFSK